MGLSLMDELVELDSMSGQERTKLLKPSATINTIEIDDDVDRSSLAYKFKLFWNDKLDKPPQEQEYISKLDRYLTGSVCLGYFAKSLLTSSITISFVNGMDVFFEMDKNQYNILLSLWSISYFVGHLVFGKLIAKVNLRYFLGFLQLSWTLILLLQFFVTTLGQLYVLRFLLGFLQAPVFISFEYLLGSWWTRKELNKRSTLLAISSSMAHIIAGPLQQFVIQQCETKHSRTPAFKWLFLVDASITFPIAVYTLIANPNVPKNSTNFYWTSQDRLIMGLRKNNMGLNKARNQSANWFIWVFPLIFYAFNNSDHAIGQPTFISWMKIDLKLPNSKYNIYPSYLKFTGLILAILVGYLSDYLGGQMNHIFILIYFISMVLGTSLLAFWNIPTWLHWFCYIFISLPSGWVQPQIFSWVNRELVGDDEKRSLVVMLTNVLAYVIGSVVPLFVWNTNDAPEYFVGFTYTAFLSLFGLIMTWVAVHFSKRAYHYHVV